MSSNLQPPEMLAVDIPRQPLDDQPSRMQAEKVAWQAFQAGNKEAFVNIYSLDAPYVLRYLTKLADKDTAEDLCQETFTRLFEKLDNFQDRGKGVLPWLYTVAHNLLLDQWEERTRHPETEFDTDAYVTLQATEDTEVLVMGRLALQDVLKAIAGLKYVDQRQAVIDMCLKGMEQAEYAAERGENVEAAKQRLLRARRNLRPILEAWQAT